MDTTSIFTTSCSTVRVETRTSTGKLMRVLWKTENCSTRTVEKCFKLLLWTIMIPNGSWCSDVIRWEEGYFQHSSFLAGEATVSAWRFVVENGVLRAVWPWSVLDCNFLIFSIVDFIIKKKIQFSVCCTYC
ncbi:unnamed protein product [Brassica oleracea var. botrytis]